MPWPRSQPPLPRPSPWLHPRPRPPPWLPPRPRASPWQPPRRRPARPRPRQTPVPRGGHEGWRRTSGRH
eukprot:3078777-Pyramimonas_sp.AAC.1